MGSFNYVFNYTDHLGNVRLSYAKDPLVGNRIKILEENHYYAFGLKHKNYNVEKLNFEEFPDTGVEIVPAPAVANASYNYKYNGKELQEELGLNMYDYGARNYDPAIGRWMNIDPLAEMSRRWTPYNYCYNNPIIFIDPDGMLSKSFGDEEFIEWEEENNNRNTLGESGKDNSYLGKENETDPPVEVKKGEKTFIKTETEGKNVIYTELVQIETVFVTIDNRTKNKKSTYDKVMVGSSGVGLANDVKSTIIEAGKASDELGNYSKYVKGLGIVTGGIQMYDSGSNIVDSVNKGELPSAKDLISFASGTFSVVSPFVKLSNPAGIAVGVAQIAWGVYTLTDKD